LHLLFVTEAETQFCAKGLIAQIQPLAINISQRVTQIQDVAVKFSPIITDCVTSNIANPIDLPRCLSKAVGPVISELATIAVQFKNIFRKYEQENTDFQAQLQQCDTQFRDTVASVGNLVEDVRKCVTKWRSREVS
jgi:flagellar biosynthesis protein FliQ